MEEKLNNKETNRNYRLWQAFQKRATLSQREFGKKYEIGTVSNVSQYLHGFRPLNLRAALKFARGLQVSLNEIAPELAALVKEAHAALDSAPIALPETGRPINVYSPNMTYYAVSGANAPIANICYVDAEDKRKLIGVSIETEEMMPKLAKGDCLIVDSQRNPSPGDIVLALVTGREEVAIREYVVTGLDEAGKDIFELRPFDNRFPVFKSDQQQIKVFAVAVEIRKCLHHQ